MDSSLSTKRGLSLSEEKTQIVHISQGFDFLGKNIKKWTIKKYFASTKTRKWIFKCKEERIFLPTTVKIIRHRLIKGKANPYDEKWRAYFDERETEKLAHKHPKRLKRILDKQEKRCTKCGGIIQTLWDGILHTPGESMTLTGKILISKTQLIHRKCHHVGAFTGLLRCLS